MLNNILARIRFSLSLNGSTRAAQPRRRCLMQKQPQINQPSTGFRERMYHTSRSKPGNWSGWHHQPYNTHCKQDELDGLNIGGFSRPRWLAALGLGRPMYPGSSADASSRVYTRSNMYHIRQYWQFSSCKLLQFIHICKIFHFILEKDNSSNQFWTKDVPNMTAGVLLRRPRGIARFTLILEWCIKRYSLEETSANEKVHFIYILREEGIYLQGFVMLKSNGATLQTRSYRTVMTDTVYTRNLLFKNHNYISDQWKTYMAKNNIDLGSSVGLRER